MSDIPLSIGLSSELAFGLLSLDEKENVQNESRNNGADTSSTLYVPIASPPTPAPSPRPISGPFIHGASDPAHISRLEFAALKAAGPTVRQQYLASILADCTPAELLFVSTTITPLLKRDFLHDLPIELSLHILDFIDDPRTLARAGMVSKFWNALMNDEKSWKRMCELSRFEENKYPDRSLGCNNEPQYARILVAKGDKCQNLVAITQEIPVAGDWEQYQKQPITPSIDNAFSYRKHFVQSFKTMTNWRRKGRLLNKHRPHSATPDGGVVTSVALDHEWIVVGLASCRIQVFSARTGVLARTLVGHDSGVWAVHLVCAGGYLQQPPPLKVSGSVNGAASNKHIDTLNIEELDYNLPSSLCTAIGLDKPRSAAVPFDPTVPPKSSDVCCVSEGWGNANALIVSGGCDKQLRVWDVKSGYCIYVLEGHSSTIRCLRVLHNRPIAVSGSRDATLRVWDVQRGKLLRTLTGHEESVRCLDVCGNQAVSGSYDCTCRVWNIDTGECLHVLRGHLHQIYSVAYDGKYIASGGLDTTVRVWNPSDGRCLALLQGHTALVCQLQLLGNTLATGGSDGRVITFSLETMSAMRRIAAHDSSVTALQYDTHFLVTGGNDGRVRLYDAATGNYIRDLTQASEAVWKVAHKYDKCVVMCKRAGKTVMEIWSFRPSEEDD